MYMCSKQEQQLKIFYLFLVADGRRTDEEIGKMNMIYEKMKIDKEDREKIEKFCDDALYSDESSDNSAHIIQIIKSILGNNLDHQGIGGIPFAFRLGTDLNHDKSAQVSTVWNLINLGYSDKDYSTSENKIVKFLSDFWDVDETVICEFKDSAETLVSLYKQEEWIKSTKKKKETIDKYMQTYENDIKRISDNIEITIKESQI